MTVKCGKKQKPVDVAWWKENQRDGHSAKTNKMDNDLCASVHTLSPQEVQTLVGVCRGIRDSSSIPSKRFPVRKHHRSGLGNNRKRVPTRLTLLWKRLTNVA